MNAELFLEPANRGFPGAGDGFLDRAKLAGDARDQAIDEHPTEPSELGGKLNVEVVHHCREGAVEQTDRAEVCDQTENSSQP
ncbi:hypothetical protein D3C80_1843220 [compost metagenome]